MTDHENNGNEERETWQNRPPDADVIALAQEFRKLAVGDIITYKQMNECVGYELRPDHRHKMERARDKVLREDMIHLVTIKNEGYTRVDQDKAVVCADSRFTTRLKGARRRARATIKGVMIGKLTGSAKTLAFALQAKQAFIGKLTRGETQKKLEAAAENKTAFLSASETLERLK